MNKVVFHEKLKYLRLNKNMSQAQLAKNLGITRQSLSKYELGIAEPNLYTLIKIANYFNCSLDSLVFDSINLDENIAKLDLDYFENELTSMQKTNALLEIKLKNLKRVISSSNYKEELSNEIFPEITELNRHNANCKEEYREVNVLGSVAAGEPCYALSDIIDTILIPTYGLSPFKEYFILNIQGDSMNELYNDKELILVEYTNFVSNSDIAIVLTDNNEATVKKVKFNGDCVVLIPMSSNPIHKPKTYKKDSIIIQGKVIDKLSNIIRPSL